MKYAHGTATVTGTLDALGNADGARESAVSQPAQFAIYQMICD
jgi:hypothetical protein